VGPRPGTFEACSLANRLDYILLSPELAALVTAGGINRMGLWGNPKNKTLQPIGGYSPRSPDPSTPPPTTLRSGSTSISDIAGGEGVAYAAVGQRVRRHGSA